MQAGLQTLEAYEDELHEGEPCNPFCILLWSHGHSEHKKEAAVEVKQKLECVILELHF
jgi:hypothetical protein